MMNNVPEHNHDLGWLWLIAIVALLHSCDLEDKLKKSDARIEALETQAREMEWRAHTVPSAGSAERSTPTTDSRPTDTSDPR